MSELEQQLIFQISVCGLPAPWQEFRFAALEVGTGPGVRARLQARALQDWRFDMAWPDIKFAVEVEGVTAQGGRHQRIGGFKDDIRKYHAAMKLGWNVYRTSGELIKNGQAVSLIERIINNGK